MTIRDASLRRTEERGVRFAERKFASAACCGFMGLLLVISCGVVICAEGIARPAQAPVQAQERALERFAADFWSWRARYQPFSTDDIPRLEHPAGERDWSASSIAKQRKQLEEFEARWKKLDRAGWTHERKSGRPADGLGAGARALGAGPEPALGARSDFLSGPDAHGFARSAGGTPAV